jgi:molybdopterin synthase sulfur carrier subunit
MEIKIRLFTTLREIANKREDTLNFSANQKVTVSMILQTLSRKYGKAFVNYVYDTKTRQVKGFLQFIVNGNSTTTLNGLDTELKDGDVLAILPPIGGG